MRKFNWKAVIPYIVIPLAFIILIVYYANGGNTTQTKTEYYQMVTLFENGRVSEYDLNLSSGVLRYKLVGDDTVYKYNVPNVNLFIDDIHENVVKYNKEHPDAPALH